MRFFVCDPDTGEFYKMPDSWVPSPLDATAFPDMQCLVENCTQLARAHLAMFTLDDHDRLRSGVRLYRRPTFAIRDK
jgi:hypothetical protein